VTTPQIGPFVVGEKPMTLLYQFQDSNGAPLNLTGYTAKIMIKERDGAALTRAAVLSGTPTDGTVTYAWQGDEFPTPGSYEARFWVGNLAQRFASVLIEFAVAVNLGAVPNI
jgi:hypothetical protein